MKTIKEIQEESRKIIILANNAEAKTYDEALEMELGIDCKFFIESDGLYKITACVNAHYICQLSHWLTIKSFSLSQIQNFKIIGRPLTLQRIFGAVIPGERDLRRAEEDMRVIINLVYDWDYDEEVLENQTEDYQMEVNKLLTGAKNE